MTRRLVRFVVPAGEIIAERRFTMQPAPLRLQYAPTRVSWPDPAIDVQAALQHPYVTLRFADIVPNRAAWTRSWSLAFAMRGGLMTDLWYAVWVQQHGMLYIVHEHPGAGDAAIREVYPVSDLRRAQQVVDLRKSAYEGVAQGVR